METNYYEILLRLRQFEYKLLEINLKPTSTFDIDIMILDTKAYIFSVEILRQEFMNRVRSFHKIYVTQDYKDNYKETYENVKELVCQKVKKTDRTIEFYIRDRMKPYNVEIKNTQGACRLLNDYPEVYLFRSIAADKLECSGMLASEKDSKNVNFRIVPSLLSFYLAIDCQLVRILELPNNIEFFIATANIKMQGLDFDSFMLYYYASSMCFVLSELQKFVEKLISEKYYKGKDSNTKLTERPQQMCNLLKEKPYSRKELAERMGIDESTVQDYIEAAANIYGVNGLKELRKILTPKNP